MEMEMTGKYIETRHCVQERMQQRGMNPHLTQLLLKYGDNDYGHGRALYKFFSRRSIQRMCKDNVDKRHIQDAEKKANLRLVISTVDNVMITMKHMNNSNKRIKSHGH
jgi:hypothetical protein